MKRYTVIDTHCDTAGEIYQKRAQLFDYSGHLSLEKMRAFESYIQFYAAWIPKEIKNPLLYAVDVFDYLNREIEKNIDIIEKISDVKQAKDIINRGKHGAIFAIEDARALCGSLSTLRMFYHLGVRAITLAWNDDNDVTDGIASKRGAGLTAFGKEVVKEMNRLNMMVDISHITKKGFWDVLDVSCAPVMASHSNCTSICGHRRNLDDAQIRAMIQSGGIICVNLYPDFLSDDKNANVKDVVAHIDHILSLGGENHVGLGSDFDGVDRLPDGFYGVNDYVKLFNEMRKNGYSNALIDKITHENMINFMERIEK